MPQKNQIKRLKKSPLWAALTGCLAGATALMGQAQGVRPVNPVDTAGTGKGLQTHGEAGDPGPAGGMSSVEPNLVKDATGTAEDLFRAYNAGLSSPFKLGSGTGNTHAAVPIGLSWGVPIAQWQFRPENAE